MKCGECGSDGEELVRSVDHRVTPASWDEKGLFHDHDPNTMVTFTWGCPNQHLWTTQEKFVCCEETDG